MPDEIYLDHNATTPLAPEVLAAMRPFLETEHANASSVHLAGRRARTAFEAARDEVAALIGAAPGEIVFCSGGTESDNLAIIGALSAQDPHLTDGAHVVTTQIEHPAVLQPCAWLEQMGYQVTYLPVSRRGRVSVSDALAALRPDTRLLSVMLANNEIGTLQPIAELAAAARERGILMHVDAVQAVGKVPVDVQALGIDLLSFTAHKFRGPKGVGALYVRPGVALAPLVRGGRQESGLRGGTENVAGVVGFGQAAQLARRDLAANAAHATTLRERLLSLRERLPNVFLNGDPEHTVPHTVNLCFLDADALDVQANLSQRGICVSVASACAAGELKPSYVLKALGLSDYAAACSLRFSLGPTNTLDEIDYVVEQTAAVVTDLRWLTAPEDIGVCDENCPCLWEPGQRAEGGPDGADPADRVADGVQQMPADS